VRHSSSYASYPKQLRVKIDWEHKELIALESDSFKRSFVTGVKCHSVSIAQCFLHCLVNTQKQARHFSLCALLSITAYFVNVLLGNTRIWETLKNVTPVYSVPVFHHTVFPSLFGEHSKTGKTRFTVCPYCQVMVYSVNVLLGNTRIWETLKNVTPALVCHPGHKYRRESKIEHIDDSRRAF
jgi:hypothetical protein